MAYTPWSVVNFEQPDVNKWNQLGENDAFLNSSLDEGQVAFDGLTGARTFTLPDANATLARTDAGQTFTGVQIFTSPKILTDISDTNGNELLKVTATASAVNEVTVANAATGGSPTLSATGGDTNIGLAINTKGTGIITTNANIYQSGVLTSIGEAATTSDVRLVLANGRSGDGNSYVDLIGDATYTTYGTRMIRNGGANGRFDIYHRGTGGISIVCQDGGGISIPTPINYAADAQANDTYVITLSPVIYAYYTGMQIIFKANTANTGAATINVNGLGAKTIVKRLNTALANSDILAGMFCLLIYDGTNFVLMNPVVN